jgi:fluoride ion exporter CrcB/FEX
MFDTVQRLETGNLAVAFANLGASVVVGLALTYAGLMLGRSL